MAIPYYRHARVDRLLGQLRCDERISLHAGQHTQIGDKAILIYYIHSDQRPTKDGGRAMRKALYWTIAGMAPYSLSLVGGQLVSKTVIPIALAGATKQRKREAPKGRTVDASALAEVEALVGTAPLRHDLLIEYLHLINDRYKQLGAAHLAALARLLGLAQTEVYEVATFYHHFDVVKEDRAGKLPVPPALTVRVCDGLSCEMAGAKQLLERLPELLGRDVRVIPAPCVGRCEQAPVAVVHQKPQCITYEPLPDTRLDPDVVLLRLNPKQVMILHDALPDMRMEGKPQCHIIAIAKEVQEVAASVGCMLSRVRTGLPNSQMTCAIPAHRLAEVVERLKATCAADTTVAAYAAEDARRFA